MISNGKQEIEKMCKKCDEVSEKAFKTASGTDNEFWNAILELDETLRECPEGDRRE